METKAQPDQDPAEWREGLRLIRRRRWYLWSAILIYFPVLKVTLMMSTSMQVALRVVAGWLLAAFIIAFFVALTRCPRCGNYFHMHGPTLLFLRKCLHCQLHLCADRRKQETPSPPG